MVRTTPEHSEEVGTALIEHGSVGIWERAPGVLTAYFSDDRPPQDVHRDLEVLIGSHGESLIIGFGVVQDEDWAAAWRASLSPLRITPRLTIVPSWTPYQPPPRRGAYALDPEAGAVARANVARNGVSGVVSVVDDAWALGPYDVVVANITAEPIVNLIPRIASVLSPSGEAILSGILADREEAVIDAVRTHGLLVRDRLQDDGAPSEGNYAWVTLNAARSPR